jgi:hypothetical protein
MHTGWHATHLALNDQSNRGQHDDAESLCEEGRLLGVNLDKASLWVHLRQLRQVRVHDLTVCVCVCVCVCV